MKSGDIILVTGTAWISKQIMAKTALPTDEITVSHAGLFICDQYVLEALPKGVVTSKYPDSFPETHYIFSPKNITTVQQADICKKALTYSADPYGWGKLGTQYLDWLTSSKVWSSYGLDKYPICSYIVAQAYKSVGLDFGVPTKGTTPMDILRFCLNNIDKYDWTNWTKGEGK